MKEIKPEHIKRFKNLARSLDKLMKEITKYNPEAEIYVEDCWNFYLMKGPTHCSRSGKPLRENAVALESVFRASGGGW